MSGERRENAGENRSAAAQTLTGSVDRVTFHNEQNGYSVIRFLARGYSDPVTVTGNFSSISPGESLQLTGWWTSHPQYGDQFRATDYSVVRPATIAGIQKYLGSGLIKGVGPVTARRIVEHFGDRTLDIIEGDITRLNEVKGIARKRVEMIQRAWAEQRAIKQVMLFLQSHGVSTHYAVKIYKQYGNDAISIVEKTPYRLAEDIYGIGFRTADQIARHIGIAADSDERLRAGLKFVLFEATDEGHCFLPSGELIERAAAALEIEETEKIESALETMIAEGALKQEEQDSIYAPPIWQAERSLARRLCLLRDRPLSVDQERVDRWLDRFAEKREIELSAEQREAVRLAARSRVMILTGGPGTGKTTTLRAMVELFLAMGNSVLLASPTGRAAQRLAEVVGREAKTIHRLLEFDPSRMAFKRDENNPLDADVTIIDESSMIDIVLANNLLKAISPDSRLVLVGDVDQLPSVGPGAVLRDLIESDSLPVVRLTEVFRQAAESLIVRNAHRINRGEFPTLVRPGEEQSDCYFLEADDPDRIVSLIVKSVSSSLPLRFGYDPRTDIQVLCPMNRGRVGTGNLNDVLQEALNPPDDGKNQLSRGNRMLREGDRVIQKVNNYKLDVFNGDMGTVERIDRIDQLVMVRFQNRQVVYDYADLLELGHGFAVTIHKSQGSEYPAVVIPLHPQHYMMLSRNLIYTALTRARKTVVLIGSTKAIGMAMRNVEATRRYTRLSRLL